MYNQSSDPYKKERDIYGGAGTPPDSAYDRNARAFYGATPAGEPKGMDDADFQNDVNAFYGTSNPASRGSNMAGMGDDYANNANAFYGVTPRDANFPNMPQDNQMEADTRAFYGVSQQGSRPQQESTGQDSMEADARQFYGVDSSSRGGSAQPPPPPPPESANQAAYSSANLNATAANLNGQPIYKGMGFKDTRGLIG